MNSIKTWKTDWKLKSLAMKDLLNITRLVINKQLVVDNINDITLETNLVVDLEADSVDIISMLLKLEDIFKSNEKIVVPTDKLNNVVLAEDLLDVIYNVLLNLEEQNPNIKIVPDLTSLE